MENFDYTFWGFVVAVIAIFIPVIIFLFKNRLLNSKSIKIEFKTSFKNESLGEPFIEIIPFSKSKEALTVMPYITSEVYIKNNGNTIFYFDELEIQFRSLGARIETNKLTYKSSEKLESGDHLTITYKFDLREDNAYAALQDCNLRFKITELSGKVFYSKFFKPEIEFNNVEI